jgi:hypothetical protein
MDYTEVTGTIYRAESTGGEPAKGVRLTIKKVVKAGALISAKDIRTPPSDDDGVITFKVPRASTVYIYGDVEGLDRNQSTGTPLAIPDTETATLESLISVASVPSQGITVTGIGNRVGTFTFNEDDFEIEQSSAGVVAVAIKADRLNLLILSISTDTAIDTGNAQHTLVKIDTSLQEVTAGLPPLETMIGRLITLKKMSDDNTGYADGFESEMVEDWLVYPLEMKGQLITITPDDGRWEIIGRG